MLAGDRIKLGVALEAPSEHDSVRGAMRLPGVSFVEYGVHMAQGIPAWLSAELAVFEGFTTLHPLDLNLAATEDVDDAWLSAARQAIAAVDAPCLVSDIGYWYYERRETTWFRPQLTPAAVARCLANASYIARHTGVPFRIENPPLEWAGGRFDLWAQLEASSNDSDVEICLDVSHLIQFEQNALCRWPELPSRFPWRRVAELHLAGYLDVELRGQRFKLDQHLAGIDSEQLKLACAIAQRVLEWRDDLHVCLEMEPQSTEQIASALPRVASVLGGVGSRPRAGRHN